MPLSITILIFWALTLFQALCWAMHIPHFIFQTALWIKYHYFPNFTNEETDDLRDRVSTRGHTSSRWQRSQDESLCRGSGESTRCMCACVRVYVVFVFLDFPQSGSMLLCYKGNYSKTKVTTKRLNWTDRPLHGMHSYQYLQAGILTHALCTGSFSLRTLGVRERQIGGKDREGLCFAMLGCSPQDELPTWGSSNSVCPFIIKNLTSSISANNIYFNLIET